MSTVRLTVTVENATHDEALQLISVLHQAGCSFAENITKAKKALSILGVAVHVTTSDDLAKYKGSGKVLLS